jgi:hypothetical protein
MLVALLPTQADQAPHMVPCRHTRCCCCCCCCVTCVGQQPVPCWAHSFQHKLTWARIWSHAGMTAAAAAAADVLNLAQVNGQCRAGRGASATNRPTPAYVQCCNYCCGCCCSFFERCRSTANAVLVAQPPTRAGLVLPTVAPAISLELIAVCGKWWTWLNWSQVIILT